MPWMNIGMHPGEHFYGHLHTEVGYFPAFGNQGGKDCQHGEAGRLIYNCEPYKFAGGGLCK